MGSSTGSSVANMLWPVMLLGGAGAFLDFLLGDQKQQQLKEWLMAKWVAFEDLRWTSFGAKEASLFVQLSDAIFGKKLFSTRRFAVCLVIASISFLYWLVADWGPAEYEFRLKLGDYVRGAAKSFLLEAAITVCFLAVSITFTRKISVVAIDLSVRMARLSFFVFLGLLLFHLILLAVWGPIVALVRDTAVDVLRVFQYEGFAAAWAYAIHGQFEPSLFQRSPIENLIGRLSDAETMANAAYADANVVVSLVANGLRIVMALGLLILLLLRRAIAPFASLVWRRIVEHKTGTFTLALGGLGATASFLKELATHF